MAGVDDEEKDDAVIVMLLTDKKTQALAALSIGLICVVIGLPVWWKTTEVYRVHLPYSDIASLENLQIRPAVYYHVKSFSEGLNLQDLQKLMNPEDEENSPESPLRLVYVGSFSPSSTEEERIFQHASTLQDMDIQLQQLRHNTSEQNGTNSSSQNKGYLIYIMPASDVRLKNQVVIGTDCAAFVPHVADVNQLVKWIRDVVRDVFVNENAVQKSMLSTFGSIGMKADKESMRSLRSSPGYDLTFTLLNPQPDVLRATWDFGAAVPKYLDPLLHSFNEYTNITVKSQYLHYIGLGVRAVASDKGSRLSNEQLPHIINPIEAYLGSHVSTNPNVNFIVYIPTREQTPLYIYDASGQKSATNAFLSPRWGGLMVYNVDVPPKDGVTSLPVRVEIDMKRVLSIFAAQLRLILGVHSTVSNDWLQILSPGNSIISGWELDQWLREHCIENVFTSAATLRSLAELLGKISNIVINDNVGAHVVTAVESIQQSVDLLASGNLKEAYLMARKAREASETAFFDPSLLELLYFPEDQKFAIYIPLFLPVGFPIVLSLLEAFKWLRGSKTKEKKE